MTTILTPMQHIKAGRLRALGVASRERSALLPDVPTFAEQGYPEAVASIWFGYLVPAATPRNLVSLLNAEINAVLALPETRERLAGAGMVPVGAPPEQFDAHVRAEAERWGNVIRTRGIKAE